VVGNNRRPIRSPWVPVVWIITQALVQFTVLAQLVAVQLDAETWLRWNGDSAVLVAHRAALDDVISQVVIMGIRGEREVGEDGPQVQHGRQLDAKLPGRMHRNAGLERRADACGAHTGAYSAPKCRIQQHNIDR